MTSWAHAEDHGDSSPSGDRADGRSSFVDLGRDWFKPAAWQPTPLLAPSLRAPAETPLPGSASPILQTAAADFRLSLLGQSGTASLTLSTDRVIGAESLTRSTTDIGNLLRKSPSALSVGTQRRTPIVNDNRIRASRVGSLAGNGSYWIPARIDLDTALSKIDSRNIEDVIVIPGPYTSTLGPAFSFTDFHFRRSPRFAAGSEWSGRTSFDYNSNGEQWLGRQSIDFGSNDWGARINYSHRTGNDYRTGNGDQVPSSYNSRDWLVTLGRDLSQDATVELNLLRVDQTGVEFPGYAFDLDSLITDGYEVEYVIVNQPAFDRLALEAWYNRTVFGGNAQEPGKRLQFPFLDAIDYVGFTDVDSLSTGFRSAATWGNVEYSNLTAGVDFRYVKQELNEVASGVSLGFPFPFADRNSPIPRSFIANPGLFLEAQHLPTEQWTVRVGAHGDFAHANLVDGTFATEEVGLDTPFGATYADVVGTDDYDRNFGLWSTYLSSDYEIDCCWNARIATGYAEQAPTLTELYAAESFMFLLQNGLNSVTGDPRLKKERKLQADVALSYHGQIVRAGARGFYAWSWDYITFENLEEVVGPPAGEIEQISLKYVNTELASFKGAEGYAELAISAMLTSFTTIKFVEAQDHTRNGDFATRAGVLGIPSSQFPGLPRGFFSGRTGGAEESLPGVSPLEATVGLRLEEDAKRPRWGGELSVRLVARQTQVAESLLETPTAGFATVNFRGFWQQTDALLWVAGIENIGDRNYREHLDFRAANGISVFQPGINVYIGSELVY